MVERVRVSREPKMRRSVGGFSYRPSRLVSQRTLMQGLIEVIESGGGVARLYASLLAAEIADKDARVMRDYGRRLAAHGVAVSLDRR